MGATEMTLGSRGKFTYRLPESHSCRGRRRHIWLGKLRRANTHTSAHVHAHTGANAVGTHLFSLCSMRAHMMIITITTTNIRRSHTRARTQTDGLTDERTDGACCARNGRRRRVTKNAKNTFFDYLRDGDDATRTQIHTRYMHTQGVDAIIAPISLVMWTPHDASLCIPVYETKNQHRAQRSISQPLKRPSICCVCVCRCVYVCVWHRVMDLSRICCLMSIWLYA